MQFDRNLRQMHEAGIAQARYSVQVDATPCSKRILIVDDNAINRRLTELQLKRMGLGSIGADSADAALKVLHDSPGVIPLIFMDCYMPGTSGFDLAKQLREKGYTMPILGISASSDPKDNVAALQAGMNAFMTRPLNLTQLQLVIRQYLHHGQSGQ